MEAFFDLDYDVEIISDKETAGGSQMHRVHLMTDGYQNYCFGMYFTTYKGKPVSWHTSLSAFPKAMQKIWDMGYKFNFFSELPYYMQPEALEDLMQ